MKLLIDENLSAHLPKLLSDCYPDSVHVRDLDMKSAPDSDVWSYAAANGYVIVTKDADFRNRSYVLGFPPKVIWIRLGNCSTGSIERLLRERRELIHAFATHSAQAFLALS